MTSPSPSPAADSRRVLVLGASDDAAAHAVELLEQLGLEPAVIDTPSIDRLDAARDAGYAIVAGANEGDAALMMAIGFMLALLGKSRICLVGGSAPTALQGATRVAIDDGDLWKLMLARELKRAGLDVDLNKAL